MSIQFSGTLTEQQFIRFQQDLIPTFAKFLSKWFPWLWLGFTLLKVLSLSDYIKSLGMIFDILIILYFLVFVPKLRERQIKRLWQNNKLIQGKISGAIDQEGIIWSHAYGEIRYPWEILLKYREAAGIFLIYISLNQVLYFPRDFFSSKEDWQQFQQLIADKLPEK